MSDRPGEMRATRGGRHQLVVALTAFLAACAPGATKPRAESPEVAEVSMPAPVPIKPSLRDLPVQSCRGTRPLDRHVTLRSGALALGDHPQLDSLQVLDATTYGLRLVPDEIPDAYWVALNLDSAGLIRSIEWAVTGTETFKLLVQEFTQRYGAAQCSIITGHEVTGTGPMWEDPNTRLYMALFDAPEGPWALVALSSIARSGP